MNWTHEPDRSLRSDGATAVRHGKKWHMFWPDGVVVKRWNVRGTESIAFRKSQGAACREMDEQSRVRAMYEGWAASERPG